MVSLYTMLELYAHSFCRASGLIGQFHQQVNCGVFPQAASFDALARIIHDLEDTKSLFCYKHVVETVFVRAREAFACLHDHE